MFVVAFAAPSLIFNHLIELQIGSIRLLSQRCVQFIIFYHFSSEIRTSKGVTEPLEDATLWLE